jgi:hypothetical protein
LLFCLPSDLFARNLFSRIWHLDSLFNHLSSQLTPVRLLVLCCWYLFLPSLEMFDFLSFS